MKNLTHLIIASFIIAGLAAFYRPGKKIIPEEERSCVVSVMPAPVLNTPDFDSVFGGEDGKTLKLDESGLVREVEFIALPGTLFDVDRKIRKNGRLIYKVTTEDYPYESEKGYYIDRRFVKQVQGNYPGREKVLPGKNIIIRNLRNADGNMYIWGGNYKSGIPEMAVFYPPMEEVEENIIKKWTFKGVDCSGLLYEATGGFTPRNTGSLVDFGRPVKIYGLSANDIIKKIEPLDIIVWKGHVVIVLDKNTVIESRLKYDDGHPSGVRIQPLKECLNEIMRKRTPVNNYVASPLAPDKKFVIRRWYDHFALQND